MMDRGSLTIPRVLGGTGLGILSHWELAIFKTARCMLVCLSEQASPVLQFHHCKSTVTQNGSALYYKSVYTLTGALMMS